jgi:beta-1,4-mannosyl-glycoprotein beta-1,4-N-acetylglucosaminyltransferase
MKVIDCFTFYNELKMLEFRLKYLYDTVDYFVIVESTVTFAGNPKPLYFQDNKTLFTKYLDKIIHIVVDDTPNTQDAWTREIFQRNCIDRGISRLELNDDDLIHISDCDEIPMRRVLKERCSNGGKLLIQRFYYYNLTTLSTDILNYAKVLDYKTYCSNNRTPHEIRMYLPCEEVQNGGWHFSYFGDSEFIKNKISNFSHQEYNSPTYTDPESIKLHIKNGDDLFGRDWHRLTRILYDPTTLPEHHEMLLDTKILVLRIYNNTPEYDAMWALHKQYDSSIAIINVPTLETEYSFDVAGRVFRVKGEEGLFRILHKTIKAFEYFLEHFEFDYIVRSNMSTVIDMNALKRKLAPLSGSVYGGHMYKLDWHCNGSGITQEFLINHWHLMFAQGSSIVVSRDFCKYIVDHQSELNYNVVDDVAIGALLKDVPCTRFESQWYEEEVGVKSDKVFYRYRWSSSRMDDVRKINEQYQLLDVM